MYTRRPTGCVRDSQFLIPKSKRVAFHAEVLQATAIRCAAACMTHFAQVNFYKQGAVMYVRRRTGCVWGSQFLIPKPKRVAFHAEVLQATATR